MADQNHTPRADDVEENEAQRQSDAAPDAAAERTQTSDRADGRGSTANGVPASDDADGAARRKLYKDGAGIVSRID
jgi:hypothetical protein